MVKRKSPIVLVTILVIGACGAYFINSKSHPPDPDAPPPSDSAQLHPNQPTPSPKDLLTKSSAPGPKGAPGGPGGMPGGPGRPPAMGDGIVQHSGPVATKPKPTDNMTASGWYNKDAPSAMPGAAHQ